VSSTNWQRIPYLMYFIQKEGPSEKSLSKIVTNHYKNTTY
jgi:hypothetical protein